MRAALLAFALLRFGLKLELGPEYDSNANHVETPQPGTANSDGPAPIESFLIRGVARGFVAWNARPHALRLQLELGGKYFFGSAAAPQNMMVVRLGLEERTMLSAHATLGLNADYHDAYQFQDCPDLAPTTGQQTPAADTSCHRDFRLVSVRGLARVSDGIPALAVELGARNYQWKPDDDQSFAGVSAGLTPSARIALGHEAGDDPNNNPNNDRGPRDLTLSASGRFEYRHYNGPALAQATDLGDPTLPRREDLVATLALTLAYDGPLLASASYILESDRSSSAGASYLYQGLMLSLAMPLPAQMVAAVKAQLLFFASGELPASQAVDDENRDAVLFDLSRVMGAGFTLRARYEVYRNAGSAPTDGPYLRQLVYAGASLQLK